VDSDFQADRAWLLSVQRKLYQWSRENPKDTYRDLWNWVTDPRNIRCAWQTVASNKGKRTPGVDGETMDSIRQAYGESAYLDRIRQELRSGNYSPSPSRRKLIPKPGKPGKFRPLGIPTIKDRIIQCAAKQIIEPLFEARFWHVSYGFRPGRGCHGALEHIRMAIRPRATSADGKRHTLPYQWVIEGDIKGCFDNIDHHHLMTRIRECIADQKVNRLILQFLKAGALSEEQFIRTENGTPQGGIISPLLANVALSVIEERYERWVNHQQKTQIRRKSDGITAAMNARTTDRKAGRPVFFPVRYADDFVVLVSGSYKDALKEKQSLEDYLKSTTRLELSSEKTKITSITEGFEFLGHRARVLWDERYGFTPRIEIPKAKILDLRHRIKQLTLRSSTPLPLSAVLYKMNPTLRGWGNFYRHCTGAKAILSSLDWYVNDRLWRWMRKKYPKAGAQEIAHYRKPSSQHPNCRVWKEGGREQFLMGYLQVQRFQRGWMRTPVYAMVSGEPDA
jgi:RNA-directed DNA polymerase